MCEHKRFRHAGLKCLVARDDEAGLWSGFVRVPRSRLLRQLRRRVQARFRTRPGEYMFHHRWRAEPAYTLRRLAGIEAPGGLAFAGPLPVSPPEPGLWLGFDTGSWEGRPDWADLEAATRRLAEQVAGRLKGRRR